MVAQEQLSDYVICICLRMILVHAIWASERLTCTRDMSWGFNRCTSFWISIRVLQPSGVQPDWVWKDPVSIAWIDASSNTWQQQWRRMICLMSTMYRMWICFVRLAHIQKRKTILFLVCHHLLKDRIVKELLAKPIAYMLCQPSKILLQSSKFIVL